MSAQKVNDDYLAELTGFYDTSQVLKGNAPVSLGMQGCHLTLSRPKDSLMTRLHMVSKGFSFMHTLPSISLNKTKNTLFKEYLVIPYVGI